MSNGLEKLGEHAFTESGIEKIQLPSTLKTIEAETFKNCKNLKSVEILDGVEHIGEQCFYGTSIQRIVFPASMKEVCAKAFCGCK